MMCISKSIIQTETLVYKDVPMYNVAANENSEAYYIDYITIVCVDIWSVVSKYD
jgi:RIO-like serine/threonine protein kinase